MAGKSVAERLRNLKQRIEQACGESGRDPGSVRLLAVSKLQGAQKIREAFALGQTDFAENYIQEAGIKRDELADLPTLRWHFIGRIQSNKIKQLAGNFHAIHSVDRLSIAQGLDRATRAHNRIQDVFLQVNLAGEASKGGAAPEQFEHFLTESGKCENLRVLGLMVMPPLENPRPYFLQARDLLRETRGLLSERHPFNELSMGTSHDFAQAIAAGATWVRIGSEIFGTREEK